jgi:hypothetical protein
VLLRFKAILFVVFGGGLLLPLEPLAQNRPPSAQTLTYPAAAHRSRSQQPAPVPAHSQLETFQRFILSAPPTTLVGNDPALLKGTKMNELLHAARRGPLSDHEVAKFAQSARADLLSMFEQRAKLPQGFFLTTTRSVQFPGGNPFLGRGPPSNTVQKKLKMELERRLVTLTQLYRKRGGRGLPLAIQLLTGDSHLTIPRRKTEERVAIREAVDKIPLLELEQRHAYITKLSDETFLAQTPSRQALAKRPELVNFDHLLSTLGKVQGGKLFIDIYAENVPARQRMARFLPVAALGEGAYCVDDIARTTVALFQAHETRPDSALLRHAMAGIDFVKAMQAPDGEFYNFATLKNGRMKINAAGTTSKKGIDYWAARALWALGEGYASLHQTDPRAAAEMAQAIDRALPRLEIPLKHFNQFAQIEGKSLPRWLINDAADQTALVVKGLLRYYQALASGPKRTRVKEIISKYCEGIARSQVVDKDDPDLGRFFHSVLAPDDKHLWGSHQVEALAAAGKALGRAEWIGSARLCADHYWGKARPQTIVTPGEDEIAYGVETVVSGYAQLYQATGKKEYARATQRWASWFVGNNEASALMYDPLSGRGYDGLAHLRRGGEQRYGLNSNSGAESTVESILALQSADRVPRVTERLRSILQQNLPR